jgi:uncharacterized membrane protein YfcA
MPLTVFLGSLVGLLMALTGAGGGILAVPLLVFVLHLGVAQAAPVGLLAVGLSAAIGAGLGLRDGLVRYRAALLIGGTGMLFAPLGVWLGRRLPDMPLTLGFAAVLVFASWRMFRLGARSVEGGADDIDPGARASWPCVLDPLKGRLQWNRPCAWALAGTGLVAGLLSGLLGVGGGFVVVPSLTRFTNLAARSVLATSLAVIALVSVGGVGAAVAHGALDWHLAGPFAAGAVGAMLVGRRIGGRLPPGRLQQGFAVVAAAVAVLLLAKLVWTSP